MYDRQSYDAQEIKVESSTSLILPNLIIKLNEVKQWNLLIQW